MDQANASVIGRNRSFENLFAKWEKVGYTLNVATDCTKSNMDAQREGIAGPCRMQGM